ncbi:MAG: GAF domain-containing protein [Oscillochloris sp.]|nr:GAF domain-containing protein [Oscillochloris sp.]
MLVSLNAADFLRYLNWALFLLIGIWVSIQAMRRPTPVNIDVGLLFGGLAVAILITSLAEIGLLQINWLIENIIITAIFSMPFLLIRLMDDVIGIPPILMRIFMVAFGLYLAVAWLFPLEALTPFGLPLILGLLATLAYVVISGLRTIRHTHGITRRRLIAVSLGSLFLALNFAAGQLPIDPEDARSLVDIFGAAAGISYYFGFTPPRWLRRIWQEPELRAFLSRSASLPQIEDYTRLLHALERGAAAALGAPYAGVGIWDADARLLRFPTSEQPFALPESSEVPAVQAFRLQKAVFSRDTRYDPALDTQFRLRSIARVVLSAPISVGSQRIGVISVFGPRVSLFSEDDLTLLQLLADQSAVVLESRQLIERSAHIRAREEAARLKEDFLSAAAHDLKTPLTTLVVQAQLFERRATRNPEAPIDRGGLRRIVAESERLRSMVQELLDAAKAEQTQLVGKFEPGDLTTLVNTVVQRHENEHHHFAVVAPDQLMAMYDSRRWEQLLDNLVENAVKYSPNGGVITIRLWQDAGLIHLMVSDQGIGIPAADLPNLFDRFHRGANVDDRRFPGWGLGLSICRHIAEQHGGTISVNSRNGDGSTFHVTIPHVEVTQERHVAAYSDH